MNLIDRSKRITMGEMKYFHKGITFHEVYQDGLYRGIHNGVMVVREKVENFKGDTLQMLPSGVDGYELKIPKVPFKYWYMVWSFYRDIEVEYGTEAAVIFYWNSKGITKRNIPKELREEYGNGLYIEDKIILYAPKQINTKTSTVYTGDRMWQWLDRNTTIILDTHSHNSMEAFFSGTDDANEKRLQFYGVYGRVGTDNTYVMRYRYLDSWYHVEIGELFTKGEIPQGLKGESTYPEQWLKQIEVE